MVTMAPSMASMSNSLGMAMISLDFAATWTCPRTRRWRAAKADTMWIAARPLLVDRREVLPSIAITPSGMPVRALTQAAKQVWNCPVSNVARISPRWSCTGVPAAKGRKRRSNANFLCPNRAMKVGVAATLPPLRGRHSGARPSGRYSGHVGYRAIPDLLCRLGQRPDRHTRRGDRDRRQDLTAVQEQRACCNPHGIGLRCAPAPGSGTGPGGREVQ